MESFELFAVQYTAISEAPNSDRREASHSPGISTVPFQLPAASSRGCPASKEKKCRPSPSPGP